MAGPEGLLGASHFKAFAGDHLEFCHVAHRTGFSWVELKFEPWLEQRSGLTGRAGEVDAFARKSGLELSVHAAYDGGLNIASFESELRQRSAQAYRESLAYAARVGARRLTVHGGHLVRHEHSRERHVALRERTADALADLQERARDDGITICVENRHCFSPEKVRYPVTPTELRECLDRIGGDARATVDSGHANSVRGVTLVDFVLGVGPDRVALTHLDDNDGVSDQHLVPGEGEVAFPPFLQAWKRQRWGYPLMLELNRVDDIVAARDRMLAWLAGPTRP
jgi:sugar phosphate isomerase/epimerase